MRDPIETAAENLRVWHVACAENRELRLLQAEALGRSLESGEPTELSDLVALPELPESTLVPSPTLYAHLASVEERLALCRGYLTSHPAPLREADTASAPASPRVAFLESRFAREALRIFEPVLPHARPLTAPSFTAVCEELSDGHADFALLPLEDSRDGRLHGLIEEIDRFEFRITHVCSIPYPDDGRSVTMALVAKRFEPMHGSGERLLACSVLCEDTFTLTDLLSSAIACGFTLRRLDSRPAPYGEGGVIYLPVFCTDGGDASLFDAYLSAFLPRARITAQYTLLKNKEKSR